MINERLAKAYCRDDISKIANYDEAVADTTQTWICHHRLELTLDGEYAHTPEELNRMDMYYNRPYFELIFLTKSEHHRIHALALSDETRRKMSESHKGRTHSDETRRKMSDALKGKTRSNETRRKMSDAQKGRTSPMKGQHHSEETKQKLSDTLKGKKRKPFSEEHRKKMRDAWVRRKAAKNKL